MYFGELNAAVAGSKGGSLGRSVKPTLTVNGAGLSSRLWMYISMLQRAMCSSVPQFVAMLAAIAGKILHAGRLSWQNPTFRPLDAGPEGRVYQHQQSAAQGDGHIGKTVGDLSGDLFIVLRNYSPPDSDEATIRASWSADAVRKGLVNRQLRCGRLPLRSQIFP